MKIGEYSIRIKAKRFIVIGGRYVPTAKALIRATLDVISPRVLLPKFSGLLSVSESFRVPFEHQKHFSASSKHVAQIRRFSNCLIAFFESFVQLVERAIILAPFNHRPSPRRVQRCGSRKVAHRGVIAFLAKARITPLGKGCRPFLIAYHHTGLSRGIGVLFGALAFS